jgi:HSP20 family molecular chaperone IbpA
VLQGELLGVEPQNVEIEFTDDHTFVVRGHSERKHTEGDAGLLEGPEETSRIEGGKGSKKATRPAAAMGAGEEGGEETARQRPRYWLSERSYGEFSRVFTFPATVDQNRVHAKFKDGILDITVPRAENRGGKRIVIQ